MRVVLASASPARLSTLRSAGLDPEVEVSGVDEELMTSHDPANLAAALAQLKCRAVDARLQDGEALVIGCDSVLAFQGEILGKPADAAHAQAMLGALAGRTHRVLTALAVSGGAGRARCALSTSRVHFAPIGADEIAAYVASGEPFGKAGAYAVQGRAAAWITRIEGSYTGIMGLPLHETARLLRRAGVRF